MGILFDGIERLPSSVMYQQVLASAMDGAKPDVGEGEYAAE